MRDEANVQQRILSRATALQKELDLEWISIVHRFDTRIDGDRVLAETTCDWEYRQASIRWNLPMTVLLEDNDLDATILHEFVHVMLAPLWDSLSSSMQDRLGKFNEFATENVTRAIQRARKSSQI